MFFVSLAHFFCFAIKQAKKNQVKLILKKMKNKKRQKKL